MEIEPNKRLKVTHFSPLSGQEDIPENYHTLLYELEERDGRLRLSLHQDNNPSAEAAEHSRANWGEDAGWPETGGRTKLGRAARSAQSSRSFASATARNDDLPQSIRRGDNEVRIDPRLWRKRQELALEGGAQLLKARK